MEENEIIEGGLYRLDIKRKNYLEKWCKHDIVIATKSDGVWRFIDTYWGSGERTTYVFDQVKDILVFEIDLNHSKDVSSDEFDQYSDRDKSYIPIGGGSERYIIDARATKNVQNIIELLEYKIERYTAEERVASMGKERLIHYLINAKKGIIEDMIL